MVAVASPRDFSVWCPFGIGGDLADLCHRQVQGVPGLRMERLGLSEHLIDDRHPQLGVVIADWVEAALGVGDVEVPSQARELPR